MRHFHNSSSQLNLKTILRPLYYGQYIGLCGCYYTFTNQPDFQNRAEPPNDGYLPAKVAGKVKPTYSTSVKPEWTSICMVAAFPPYSRTQPHLVSTQCSHTFAFLATEQLNWSNWGFSESSKGTSTVAAEGWENITHSFKPASPKPASLTFRQIQFLICVFAGVSWV